MKKLLFAIAMICSVLSVSAQRAGDATAWNDSKAVESDFNHSGFILNPTIGVMTGDVETGFGIGVDLGYRWHISSGFNWDIITAGISTNSAEFSDNLNVRLLSGFRYNSPAIFGDKGLYANLGLGYQLMTSDTDLGGFAYEVGVGINLTRIVSLGLVWEGNTASTSYSYKSGRNWYEEDVNYHWGMFGVRLGLNF